MELLWKMVLREKEQLGVSGVGVLEDHLTRHVTGLPTPSLRTQGEIKPPISRE